MSRAMMALLDNLNRDPKKDKNLKPSDFNPFTPEPPKVVFLEKEKTSAQ